MAVLKRDGSVQPFDIVKVFRSARMAGASPQDALKIANEVKERMKGEISTGEIKSIIYQFLLQKNQDAARNYVLFRKRRT